MKLFNKIIENPFLKKTAGLQTIPTSTDVPKDRTVTTQVSSEQRGDLLEKYLTNVRSPTTRHKRPFWE